MKTQSNILIFLILALFMPRIILGQCLTSQVVSPNTVIESFENIPVSANNPLLQNYSGYGYTTPLTPFTFPSGLILSEPNEVIIGNWSLGLADWGLCNSDLNSADVPNGSSFIGINGGLVPIFIFPSNVSEVGLYVEACPGIITLTAFNSNNAVLGTCTVNGTGEASNWKNNFLGFTRSQGDIAKIAISGYYVVLDELTFSSIQLPPTITSFSPQSGPVGTSVIITGANFSDTPENNIIYFGATKATVTAATATQLTVTVPTGATYAPITVLNTVTGLLAYSSSNFTPTFTPSKGDITTTDFSPKVDFTTDTNPWSVAIGDLDGDGKADLAVANYNSNTVSVFRNTGSSGTISYAAKVGFTTGTTPWNVAIGDLDGDGKADLAVANYTSNTVSVFRNTGSSGTISYAANVDFTTGTNPASVAIGDLDGDGKADLAVANYNSATVSVFRNTGSSGTISYAAKVDFTTGGPTSVAIGDLDGDGKADLAVANYLRSTVSVFRNTGSSGTISYAAKVDFTTGILPRSVAIGDLDGDGQADLAVANYWSITVSIIRNNPCFTPPTVSAASSTPTLCISTALTAITHTTTGATGIGTPTNLPAGVTAAWASNTITISGTPTASGTFNYSIPLTGCGNVNATGTITVTPANTVSAASSTPTLCISTALTAITHTTTGATGIGTPTNLPAGVTASWAANTITISGTPTASGTFGYTIPLTGGCGSVNATGTISVSATPTTAAAGSDQALCNLTTATLAGNSAVVGTGAWSVVSGTAVVTTPSSSTSGVTGLTIGAASTLRWTISNGGCTASTDDVVINVSPLPTITLGAFPSISAGTTTPNLPYSATTGSPNEYTINFDATAEAQGFVDVAYATNNLTASPIILTVPGGAIVSVYNATITVRNTSTGCSGTPTALILSIVKGNQTITFDSLVSKTYGDAQFALTATASSGLAISYATSDPTVAIIVGGMVNILKAGTTVITASQGGNANYLAAADVPQTLTVNKASQTIFFHRLPITTYGTPSFDIKIGASSGLPLSFIVDDPTVATIRLSAVRDWYTVTILNVGTTKIIAMQEGNENFLRAESVGQTLTVNKANQTLSVSSSSPTDHLVISEIFGGGGFAGDPIGGDYIELYNPTNSPVDIRYMSIQYAPSGSGGWKLIPLGLARVLKIHPGQYFLIARGGLHVPPDLDLPIDISERTGKMALVNVAFPLSGSNPLTSRQPDGVQIIDFVGYGAADAFEGAGPAVEVGITSSLERKSSATSTALSMQKGGNEERNGNAYDSDNNANDFVKQSAPNPQFSGSGLETPISGRAWTITDKTYGDAPFALDITASSGLPVVYASTNMAVATISGNMVTIIGAGTTTITANQPGDNYYNAAPMAKTLLSVSKALLIVTADNKTIAYGDDLPPFTISYDGFIGSDDASVIDSPPDAGLGLFKGCEIPPIGVSSPQFMCAGWGYIDVFGGSDNNYSIIAATIENSGKLTINKATLMATADNKVRNVGEPNPPFTITYSGFKGTEDPTYLNAAPTASTTTDSTSLPGGYPITLTGGDAINYVFDLVEGTLSVINGVQTISFDSLVSKTYGDSPFNLSAVASSGLPVTYSSSNPEVVSFAGNTATILQAGTTVITASQPGNYYYNPAPDVHQTLTINQASQSITFGSLPVKSVGDAPFDLTAVASSGLIVTYLSSNPAVASVNGSTVTILSADTATITASQPGNVNYLPAPDVPQTLIIVTRPYVLSPKDGETDQPTSLAVKSQIQTGAQSYTIELCLLSDFSSGVISKTGLNSQEFSGLAYNTKYFARVKTNLSDYGKTTFFTTVDPLSLTLVASPKDGSKNVTTTTAVNSNIVPDATSYTIELSTQSDFAGDTTFRSNSSTNSVTFTGLAYSTVYYTRVQTNVVPDQWGAVTSFITERASKKSARSNLTGEQEEVTGIEVGSGSANVYPNPFGRQLTVHVQTEMQEKMLIQLFDLTGKESLRQEALTNRTTEIETGLLGQGMYMLKIATSNIVVVRKVIKK